MNPLSIALAVAAIAIPATAHAQPVNTPEAALEQAGHYTVKVALEALKGELTLSQLATKHGVI